MRRTKAEVVIFNFLMWCLIGPMSAPPILAGFELRPDWNGIVTDEDWVKQLDSVEPNTRFKAVLRLGLARDPAAIEALGRLADDSEWQIREVAGWALGQMKDPKALNILIQGLHKEKFSTYAAIALGEMGDLQAVEPLLRVIQDPRAPKDSRGAAAESLGLLKDGRAVEPLLALVNDKTVYTGRREITVKIDKEKGNPVMSQIMSGKAIYRTALQSLVTIADKRAAVSLKKLLETETDEDIRKATQDALTKLQ